MTRTIFFSSMLALAVTCTSQAQTHNSQEHKYFIGSTLFMLANLVDDPEPPKYYQLNLGYRLTPSDVVSLELITWNYYEPLGVPYAEKKTTTNFPGNVQAFGAGLAYKRFVWKRAYAQLHSTALKQHYLDVDGSRIQSGFQLFNTVRLGYQFRLFQNRAFIEPSVAMTFWPINTNLPTSFQTLEDQFPAYFLGEPGLHFGINF